MVKARSSPCGCMSTLASTGSVCRRSTIPATPPNPLSKASRDTLSLFIVNLPFQNRTSNRRDDILADKSFSFFISKTCKIFALGTTQQV
ncbi:hypothetical protein THIX_10390 [Thiomonas sp. X19]|nr:hypothetical protein THIX_10390 [Thiomonas sp. X19]